MPEASHAGSVRSLLDWYRETRKPLPWRVVCTPYRAWLGEVMSQQTALVVVVPRFESFVAEISGVESLAACTDEKLGRLWAGLGYYARARNLKAGAQHVVGTLGGSFPRTFEGWLAVPGCGPCTAAMVSSMCFGVHVPAVDGNAVRVASRLLALREHVWTADGQRRIHGYLDRAVRLARRPGDLNQAVMELGQEICRKAHPLCGICPIAGNCLARKRDLVDKCPPPRPRRPAIDTPVTLVVLRHVPTKTMLLGTRKAGLLARTTGLPILVDGTKEAGTALERIASIPSSSSSRLPGRLRHSITRHRISGRILAVTLRGPRLAGLPRALGLADPTWVPEDGIVSRLSSSLDVKAIALLA